MLISFNVLSNTLLKLQSIKELEKVATLIVSGIYHFQQFKLYVIQHRFAEAGGKSNQTKQQSEIISLAYAHI